MYNYVQAQDMYLQSLEVCKECDLDSIIPRVYNNLGNIYSSFNDFKKPRITTNKRIKIVKQFRQQPEQDNS